MEISLAFSSAFCASYRTIYELSDPPSAQAITLLTKSQDSPSPKTRGGASARMSLSIGVLPHSVRVTRSRRYQTTYCHSPPVAPVADWTQEGIDRHLAVVVGRCDLVTRSSPCRDERVTRHNHLLSDASCEHV